MLMFFTMGKKVLIQACLKNSVLVMDNASFRKRQDIIELIENKGHMLCLLPPYSPCLNPIEKKWAYLKSIR